MGFIMEKESSFKDAANHYEAAWRYSNKVIQLATVAQHIAHPHVAEEVIGSHLGSTPRLMT